MQQPFTLWYTLTIGLLRLIYITTSCLANLQTFFDPPIDAKIWYRHGLKSILINPKPSIIILPNIKGSTFESNKIL